MSPYMALCELAVLDALGALMKVLPIQDRDILAISQQRGSKIAYILSLGVSRQHRRNGVASLLLDNLLMHLTTEENKCVKAVLLHVLTSNASAIRFYENRSFRLVLCYKVDFKKK